jgi:hypothetical protein
MPCAVANAILCKERISLPTVHSFLMKDSNW